MNPQDALHIGDRVLAVNGKSLFGLPHKDVIALFAQHRNAPVVTLLCLRYKARTHRLLLPPSSSLEPTTAATTAKTETHTTQHVVDNSLCNNSSSSCSALASPSTTHTQTSNVLSEYAQSPRPILAALQTRYTRAKHRKHTSVFDFVAYCVHRQLHEAELLSPQSLHETSE